MSDPLSVIIPARNEAQTIGGVVRVVAAMADVAEIVVIDNASSDGTAGEARAAGARVIAEPRAGMGHAVRAGMAAARQDWVMKVDADLGRFETALFARMPAARAPGIGLIKGAWQDPRDNMPMTRLLVSPALRLMYPGLGHLSAPNTGIYLVNRALIAHQELTGDYAVDLDVMLRVHAAGVAVREVDIGRIVHDLRDVRHYNAMAEQILRFFLSRQADRITQEMVVLAQGADAVVRHAFGVVLGKVVAGGRVSVYLRDAATPAACLLRDSLAAYPTARVLGASAAQEFVPHANAGAIAVIAAAPLLAEARGLCRAVGGGRPVDLLLMPEAGSGGFAPDTAFDVSARMAAKGGLLARLIGPDAAGGCGRSEIFQRVIP